MILGVSVVRERASRVNIILCSKMYVALLLTVVLVYVSGYGENDICKIPNGDAGTCVHIYNCRPILNIYNKKRKTPLEHVFIGQSYCGNPSTSIIKVCCPPIFSWQNFRPDPIIYYNPLYDVDKYAQNTSTTPKTVDKLEPVTTPTITTAKTTSPTLQTTPTLQPSLTSPTLPTLTTLSTSPTLTTLSTLSTSQTSPASQTNANQVINLSGEELNPITNSPTVSNVLPLALDVDNKTDPIRYDDSDDNNIDSMISDKNETCGLDKSSGNRITGGEPTAIDQYPWLVLLEYQGGVLGCGGSLITSQFVLTAAHCIESTRHGRPKYARLAEYNISSYPIDLVEADGGGFEEIEVEIIEVQDGWAHPDFTLSFFTNDIGILKLAKMVEFDDFKQIICLPFKDFTSDFNDGIQLTVAGWGDEYKTTKYYDVKKEVSVPYVPMERCKDIHKQLMLNSQICAGGEEGKDTCKGDSGGPLMYKIEKKHYVVGVVSFGPRDCGTQGQPAVYTHVHKYISWIRDVINERA